MRRVYRVSPLLLVMLACGAEDDGAPIIGIGSPPPVRPGDACAIWRDARTDLSEAGWSGAVSSCDPGDMVGVGRDTALRVLNGYRALAGLPDVTLDPENNAAAQACAVIMHANGMLSHDPPTSWRCYSAGGARGAGASNIATAPAVRATDLYMVDPGNDTTLGHRRWILSNQLGVVGIGSTTLSSCLWVLDGSVDHGRPWMAWPPSGAFPIQAMSPDGQSSVDDTGWSFQSDTIDLSAATVTVEVEGVERPVRVRALDPGYGSSSALAFTPEGWRATAGERYDITVRAVRGGGPIAYSVALVDCS